MQPLSPECRLVFGSADVVPDVAALRSCVTSSIDWQRVVMLAETERAVPVLWRALRDADVPLPAIVADRLRGSAMVHDFRMQRLAGRLATTIACFHARGIPVVLLKGAALAATRYGAFTDRPMSDADLLVHPEDAPRAAQAVIDSGWPRTTDPALLELLQAHHHLPPFLDPEPTGLRIELHTDILPPDSPFVLTARDLWEESVAAPAPFAGARVPSATHLLLHAATHFAWSHTMRFGAWRTFRDVSMLLREGAGGRHIVARARAARAVTSLYWTLRLARRLARIPVADELLVALEPPTPAPLRDAVERHFVSGIAFGEGPMCPSSRLDHWLWLAALRPGWSGHPTSGRSDPEHRWARARGTFVDETGTARLGRHARGIRHWWHFATRTLIPFD